MRRQRENRDVDFSKVYTGRSVRAGVYTGPSPEMIGNAEADQQVACFAWLRCVLPLYDRQAFAVPNARKFRGSKGARAGQWRQLYAEGAESGVCDLLIPGSPPACPAAPGIAIELKRPDGTPSDVTPKQRHWLLYFAAMGWLAAPCYGYAQLRDLCRAAGYLEGGPRC